MIAHAFGIGGIAALVALGVLAANLLRDRGVETSVSRRVAAIVGGAAYLLAVLCLDPWVAAAVSATIALLFLLLRLRFRQQVRGLSESDPAQRWAEIAYPLAGAASFLIGWGWLGDRWLAFIPIAFMAWGDNAAGLVRASISNGRQGTVWPSAAMLAVSLAAAALYEPYWIGAIGAIVATAVERFHPTTHPLWDDNWVIVAASLSAMGTLTTVSPF